MREGELEVSPAAVSLILACLDRIRSIMGDLEATGHEPEGEDSELIKQLNAFAEGGAAPASAAAPARRRLLPKRRKPESRNPESRNSASTASIYEQVGGMGTIDAVVEVAFGRFVGDLRMKHLFDGSASIRCKARCATTWRSCAAVPTAAARPRSLAAALPTRSLTPPAATSRPPSTRSMFPPRRRP